VANPSAGRIEMNSNRKLAVLLLAVFFLISGAYGESVSVGRGSSVAVSEGSSAEGILTSDGSVTQSSVSSSGVIDNLNIDPWVKNTNGDYAEIGVTGTNLAGFSYSDNYYPGKGDGWTSNAVSAQQWLSASSADSLHAYARASNFAGDSAGADLNLNYGSLKDYCNAAYAGAAPWLGVDRGAFVQQIANNAKGNYVLAQTWATDPTQDATGTFTEVNNGALNGYSAQADAVRYTNGLIATGVSLDSVSASAPSGSISQIMNTYDNKGDWSWVGTSIYNGNLLGNSWAYSISQQGLAESNQNVNAKGTSIDMGAHAQNSKPGNEYLSYLSGTIKTITAPTGSADFEFQTPNSLTTSIDSKATTENVLISPTLPTETKTAIMLEPMDYAFTAVGGATNLGATVFPTLVGKQYAVLRYTDSGASSDKFQNLGNYNVVLVDSHMDSNGIGLSTNNPNTNSNYLPASQLNYQNSKNSLVLFAGCDSFDGYPQKSALASVVSNAGISGGYANSVEIHWDQDYLSYFFDALGNGNTASLANTNAKTLATYKYGSNPYFVPLVFYGDQNFKL
jgi:hypothetical protein